MRWQQSRGRPRSTGCTCSAFCSRWTSTRSSSTTVPSLRKTDLARIDVPLPNLIEQRRIAAILDQADSLRCKRRTQIRLLELLPVALYESMFASEEFPQVPIGDLIVDQHIGLDRRAAEQGGDREYDYVKMDAITREGALDLSTLTRIDASAAEAAKYSLEDGDLILNTRNSRELVGKTAVYRGGPRLYNNNLMRIRFDARLMPDYVHRFLWSRAGRRQLEARKSGTTNVFAIYAKTLATLEIPVPPVELQSALSDRVEHINTQLAHLSRTRTALDSVFASLQSRAFRGEL
jgi:type I restriction enzyme S subunit